MNKVFSADRLSSLVDMSRFNSHVSNNLQKGDSTVPNVAPLQTQTDHLESIADEDAPMKAVHGDTETKLTEVN